MADLKNATTYRENTVWSNGEFKWKEQPSSSDPHDNTLSFSKELFWIAKRPRGQGGGEPEDTPRRWVDIQGEERRALMPRYDAFMKGYDSPVDGTRLTDWLDSPLVNNLVRSGIVTVEELAAAPHQAVAGSGIGCLAIQRKAQEFVANKEATKGVNARAATLEAQVAALQAQLAALTTVTPAEREVLAEKPKRKYTRRDQTEGAGQAMTG